MGTQDKIIEAFSLGKFPGCDVEKPKHIATAISNVFICGERVYKIYKNNNEDFNRSFYDISNKQNRFGFTRNDFSWNHNLNKEIYLELCGILWKDDSITFTDPSDDADEMCIVMDKIDMHNGLAIELMDGRLTPSDFYQIGYQLAERMSELPEVPDNGIGVYQDLVSRVRDTDEWLRMVRGMTTKHIPENEGSIYIAYLQDFVDEHKSALEEASHLVGTIFDIHSENAVYEHEKFFPIDTYPPKESWRRGYKHINIYRIATDVYALRGEKEFRKVLRGYKDFSKEKIEKRYEKFFVVYASVIMCPYFYVLGEHDPLRAKAAKKYHTFLRSYFQT